MALIGWIEATAGDPRRQRLWDFMKESVTRLLDGRAENFFTHLSFASGGIRTVPGRLLNDAAVLHRAVTMAPHVDAVVIGCWGAPTAAVRAALNVPVGSVAEGSVRVVSSLARRAVIVTVAPSLVPIFTADLREMGATGFHAERPVRSYAPETTHDDLVAALDEPGILIDRFDAAAQLAVADGADVIVVGCAYVAAILSANGYTAVRGHPDISVLDCNRLAVEHLLMLSALDREGTRPSMSGYGAPADAAAADFHHGLSRLSQDKP